MNDAHRRAVHLAQFYFRLLAERAGTRWEGDNDTEVEMMVSFIIDAAAERLRSQLDDAIKRIRQLEAETPQARQLQAELDATLADNAAAGYGEDYYGDYDDREPTL